MTSLILCCSIIFAKGILPQAPQIQCKVSGDLFFYKFDKYLFIYNMIYIMYICIIVSEQYIYLFKYYLYTNSFDVKSNIFKKLLLDV